MAPQKGRTWKALPALIGLVLILVVPAACGRPGPTPGTAATSAAEPPTAATTGDAARRTAPRAIPNKVIWGAYLDLSGLTGRQSLALRRTQLGRDMRITHLFYEWTDHLPASVDELPEGLPVDGLAMLSWRGTHYASINNGSQDDTISRNARLIARYGKPLFLRWAWEMNGNWYTWSAAQNDGQTTGYVAAWRRIHRIFTAAHATNVAWVWSPNFESKPDTGWNKASRYYPGDEYVDWIGVSGYTYGRETPGQLFDPFLKEFGGRKPIMIAETGVAETGGRTKADLIRALQVWITANPLVASLVWFDTDTNPGGTDWRIDTTAAATAAYRAMVTDPRFRG